MKRLKPAANAINKMSVPPMKPTVFDSISLTPPPSMPPGENGSASAELSFSLDGYQNVTVTAQGTGPEVLVKQNLPRLKKTVVKKNPLHPPGYKDDPYQ